GRYDGRDGIGGVVECVDEIECEGDEDQQDGDRKHYPCFTTVLSMTFATSSQRSVAWSRKSSVSFHLMTVIGLASSLKRRTSACWCIRSASFSRRLISTACAETPLACSSADSA